MRTSKLHVCAFLAVGFCLAVSAIRAETIETFTFDAELDWSGSISHLRVGPEGDIWFCLETPLRLMRISEGEMRCIYDSGIERCCPSDVSFGPDGTLYLDNFRYAYSASAGLQATGIEQPRYGGTHISFSYPGLIDADLRMYCIGEPFDIYEVGPYDIWELVPGASPILRYEDCWIFYPIVVSIEECWGLYQHWSHGSGYTHLDRINLSTGNLEFDRDYGNRSLYELGARDSEGRLWLVAAGPCRLDLVTFDGQNFSVFAEGGDYDECQYGRPVLTADWTVWCTQNESDFYADRGMTRFSEGDKRFFSQQDGLLEQSAIWDHCPVIDYDGNVWLTSWFGVNKLSDGGWPPMRLMLHEVATEGTIAVEAQVINNGPVVGVDVYIALEMNGQLLYWPNWQPEPHANQINLRPGHNQTATIIEARREDIPPGDYTFWGRMTGRNTSKLIGPIDRKFESLTIRVD